jgi:hypothetical protein
VKGPNATFFDVAFRAGWGPDLLLAEKPVMEGGLGDGTGRVLELTPCGV